MTHTLLLDVEIACMPAAAMSRLAALRGEPGVEVALHARDLWVRWPSGNEKVAGILFAINDCRLFLRDGEFWHEWGRRIPAFDVPDSLRYRPLDQVIFPAPFEPLHAESFTIDPVELHLVPDTTVRPTQALSCSIREFTTWAESMPSCALERLRGAVNGDRLCVLGKKLPWIAGGERFWGRTLLVPIGFRPEPLLPEEWLRLALGIENDDLLILRPGCGEVVAQDLFAPLSLGSLRLVAEEVAR